MEADYIKTHLCGESGAYQTYLCNTDILARQYVTPGINVVEITCEVYTTQPENVSAIPDTQVAVDDASGTNEVFAQHFLLLYNKFFSILHITAPQRLYMHSIVG